MSRLMDRLREAVSAGWAGSLFARRPVENRRDLCFGAVFLKI